MENIPALASFCVFCAFSVTWLLGSGYCVGILDAYALKEIMTSLVTGK